MGTTILISSAPGVLRTFPRRGRPTTRPYYVPRRDGMGRQALAGPIATGRMAPTHASGMRAAIGTAKSRVALITASFRKYLDRGLGRN